MSLLTSAATGGGCKRLRQRHGFEHGLALVHRFLKFLLRLGVVHLAAATLVGRGERPAGSRGIEPILPHSLTIQPVELPGFGSVHVTGFNSPLDALLQFPVVRLVRSCNSKPNVGGVQLTMAFVALLATMASVGIVSTPTSAFGFAPCGPPWWRRTLKAGAEAAPCRIWAQRPSASQCLRASQARAVNQRTARAGRIRP